jgi:hypothetical protein
MPFHSLSSLKGLLDNLDKLISTDPLVKGTLTFNVEHKLEANALLLELGANTDPELGHEHREP